MCFGCYDETSVAAGNVEASDNATNAYLRVKYNKRSSWLSSKVHRIKKMVRPVIELLQKSHRNKKLHSEEKSSPVEYPRWDSDAEELDNDANEAAESKFPEISRVSPCCCNEREACHFVRVPLFFPVAWAADADICLREGGLVITSSQTAERQSPCYY